ncbi:hypothetical protein HP2RS_00913 [Helicobacter pylori]|nr:hypothetical protein HP2RS_00913 [Helicobacter pylori]OUC11309.1 hypothetical protein X568_01115 [Helicobacter pylori SS1]
MFLLFFCAFKVIVNFTRSFCLQKGFFSGGF